MTEDEARAELARQNFSNVALGSAIETDNCDEPKVQKQTPTAGTQIRVDQPVSFQLCKSPDKVTVPNDLIGSTRKSAEDRLTALGLKPDIKNVDSDQPKNTVVDVEKAGQQVDPGTTITVSISRGNLVPVPNVLGKTQEQAIQALQAVGLNANVQEGDPSPNPGVVASQDPSDGKLAKGKSVTIVVTQPEPDNSGTPTPGDTTTPPGGSGGGNGNPVTGLLS
jgi:eukaryotic-like serine/threonine-protein kinase